VEHLILFAKTGRLHEVKTRLAPRLNPEQVLLLHEAMLDDQMRFVESLSGAERSFEVCLDTQQGDGDLGERMNRALDRAFASGSRRAVILGADAPTLPGSIVENAFELLGTGADAVIIPAHDGGYVLVGASHPVPALFKGIPWGTPSVADATRRLALAAGLVLAETAPWFDVDVASDLLLLARELAENSSRAPRTASCLAQLGLYGQRNPMV
jgi:rSAM/selenodomain-associated transferase 1